MKRDDSGNQSLGLRAWAPFCLSGCNYDGKGKRITVLSHLGVPLVGLILLAILPFGESIKQSVPRVKLSHKGKGWNAAGICADFIIITDLHLISYTPQCSLGGIKCLIISLICFVFCIHVFSPVSVSVILCESSKVLSDNLIILPLDIINPYCTNLKLYFVAFCYMYNIH